jgi:uncharacterized protein (UPF0332 family)
LSPEATDYFQMAERALERARDIAKAGVYEVAAREAYISALNAARAVIFDKTGNATKTHAGVRTLLSKLIQDGMKFDPTLAAFLRQGFDVKQATDYGPHQHLEKADAELFIERAEAFLAAARAAIADRS